MTFVAAVISIMTVIAWWHTVTGSIEGGPDGYLAVLALTFVSFGCWVWVAAT